MGSGRRNLLHRSWLLSLVICLGERDRADSQSMYALGFRGSKACSKDCTGQGATHTSIIDCKSLSKWQCRSIPEDRHQALACVLSRF